MSARAGKLTRTAAPEKATNTPAKKRWTVHVNQAASKSKSNANTDTDTHVSTDRLRLAALQVQALPYRQELEAYFDTDLGSIRAYCGPDVDAALEADSAQAAVQGEAVLLSADADKPIVAHEVAHILQQRVSGPRAPVEVAETEALQAEALVSLNRSVPTMSAGLYPGAVLFRQIETLAEAQLVAASDRELAQEFQSTVEGDGGALESTTQEAGVGAESDAAQREIALAMSEVASDVVDLGEPIPDVPVPTFEPALLPEIEVDDAATTQAEAALEGAEDADGLMAAFKDAPPSIKAMHHDRLEGEVGEMAVDDQTRFEAELPEFQAEMTGTDDLAEAEPVRTPEALEVQLEDGTPPPPPEPELDPTPDPGAADLNASGNALISNWFTEGDADGLGRAFNNVSTGDNEVQTSAGVRPDVPLEGASDPQRLADQDTAARADATRNRQLATDAVLSGPGPEQVELQEVREAFSMEARESPQIEQAEGPVEGAAGFRDKALDGEVVALFDAYHNESMAASMDAATSEVSTAVESRNTERDTKVAETEAEKDRLNSEADDNQRHEVGRQRQEIQDARQTAVDSQAQHVADVETEADLQSTTARTEIDTQVSTTDAMVESRFSQAENEAEQRVQAGEREAGEERQRQEREAESLSWWERAASWVADQFDKLTQFINDVFDAVRTAVSDLIDAVKTAALALIDLAAKAIIRAITVLGEALKSAVNELLAEHFPAVAAALNDAIDSAVEAATDVVNAVADGLKAAVSALLDALAAGLDAILAVFQAAINAALAIARAALTGDWGALAKLILEPVLLALGIQPAAFYDVIARAVEALDIIIDDPLGFLSNLVEGFVGGVRKFGANFLTHLQAGIIGWLTGALGGDIQIPAKFDLAGVLDLAQQILGLTVDMIRRVAVRVLGEAAVERIEFFMSYVVELITGGFSALWDKIMADLSNLKDMVLDAIKSFLVERVIMAAISWLAGLFSPVGALIKLVMTIWNFIMFLKDQLARIMEVVQTIIGTLYEIATGVLEPARQGVENVLARLLPIAIDLLARLLGLGNVSVKVREIINNVRQRIEDAIVNLINRVLSALTGGRMGGGAGDQDDEAAAQGGEIMTPISLQGGGESHTLSIEDQGETVVPMIRSTPMTVQDWLNGRAGDPFTDLATARNWRGIVKTNKTTELKGLVDLAKVEEAELDSAAEAAEDAPSAETKAATEGEGEGAKRALVKVLEFFGIDPNENLADRFDDSISELGPVVGAQLRANVMDRLDKPRYVIMEWQQARVSIASEGILPNAWKRPAATGGIVRRVYENDFLPRVAQVAEDEVGAGTFSVVENAEAINSLLDNFVTERLNRAPQVHAIVTALLDASSQSVDGALAPVEGEIKEGAKAYQAAQSDAPDIELFNTIKGSTIFGHMRAFAEGSSPRFSVRNPNEADGADEGNMDLLEAITESGKTSRYTKNLTYVAATIRNAPGLVRRPHEWVQAASADRVLQHAATALDSGDQRSLKAASELIEFQEKVRTPTFKLIFKPGGEYGGNVVVNFKARAHRESAEHAETGFDQLPENLKSQWYPPGGPQSGDELGVLQAHSGGLYAFANDGGFRASLVMQSQGSGIWHEKLTENVQVAADRLIATGNATPLKEAILGFYSATIWEGIEDPSNTGGRLFQNYYRSQSESSLKRYGALKSEFAGEFRTVLGELTTSIDTVLGR